MTKDKVKRKKVKVKATDAKGSRRCPSDGDWAEASSLSPVARRATATTDAVAKSAASAPVARRATAITDAIAKPVALSPVARRATATTDAAETNAAWVARATCCPGSRGDIPREQEAARASAPEEPASGATLNEIAPTDDPDDDHKPPLQPKRTRSEARRDYWHEVHAGTRPKPQPAPDRPPAGNPLIHLPEQRRATLFAWLRECPYDDAVQVMLRDQGLPDITRKQLDEFFRIEAEEHWERRIGRAADEAHALVQLAERSPVKFSAGILAALGQEAFRQIASGQVEPEAMGKLANLFLKARSDERADQMQELKREKMRHDLDDQVNHALEKLAEEVDRHPAAREAFEALKRELEEKEDL